MCRHRRIITGLAVGLIACPILAVTIGSMPAAIVLGAALGPAFALLFARPDAAAIDGAMAAAALGIPLWALVNVIALPLLAGHEPHWTAVDMATQFPALSGWVLFGFALGLIERPATALAARLLGPEPAPPVKPAPVVRRIVILGGGFAGVSTAERLEALFGADPSVAITLVSETNALLFTPMLAEVAASSLEAPHISSPLRTSLRRTAVVRGKVAAIDVETRRVRLDADAGDAAGRELEYDHLVLALGAVSNYLGMANVERHAFDFKSLADAIAIRNHVIDVFERADREADAAKRRALVTFVIAGGGFAGAELCGGINDFARGMLAYYPRIPRDEVKVVLVHSRDRILPELSAPLAAYALERMAARGVTFKLNVRLQDAREGVVVLSGGEEISAATLVWTAGTAPNPLLKSLAVERDKRGAVITEATLALKGHPGLWAVGDCAAIPDLVAGEGKTCPPTAQFAIREADRLARNIHASLKDRPLVPFRFAPLGALCVVGHHTACAEIKGLRFSGLFAWLLWRGIYLSKLPTLERKVRVLIDWVIELFFPRDIVQTVEAAPHRQERAP